MQKTDITTTIIALQNLESLVLKPVLEAFLKLVLTSLVLN
jgi:hypothetical protein